jgi:hypothetical protein
MTITAHQVTKAARTATVTTMSYALRCAISALCCATLGLGCNEILGLDKREPFPAEAGPASCKPGEEIECPYGGPDGTNGVGICKASTQTCNATGTGYEACQGEVLPVPEDCGAAGDEDCDGVPCSDTLWANGFGDSSIQAANDIAVDSAGNVFIVGTFSGAMRVGTTTLIAGYRDIFFAKFDASGPPIWAKQFGGQGDNYAYSVAADSSGNVILTAAGAFDFGGGVLPEGIVVAKFDSTGAHLWSRSCGGQSGFYGVKRGGVAIDADGAVIIAESYEGTADCGGGGLAANGVSNILVAKFDTNGSLAWSQGFAGGYAYGYGVAVDAQRNILFTGATTDTINFGGGNLTGGGAYLVRFAPDGAYSWGAGFLGAEALDIAVDDLGGPAVIGRFSGTVSFGGSNLTAAGDTDVFVAKFNAAGDHVWSKSFGDSNRQTGTGIAVGSNGDVVTTGSFNGYTAFGTESLTSAGKTDVFVAKFDVAGTHKWSKRYGAAGDEQAWGLAVDGSANILVAGQFTDMVDFGTGSIASGGDFDAFLMKIAP